MCFSVDTQKKGKAAFAASLIYAAITLCLVLNHETWADEAQPWLMAQDLSFFGLLKEASAKGHPYLFYLLIYPLAKTGAGIISMKIICWLFPAAAVFLLFFLSPFSLFLNSLIALSGPLLYFFPVISRSYSLLPFLVFSAASVSNCLIQNNDNHNQKYTAKLEILYILILLLIGQTHFIMSGFSCLLLMEFLFVRQLRMERSYRIIYLLVPLGFILPAAQAVFGMFLNDSFNFSPFYSLIFHPEIFFFSGMFSPLTPGFIADTFMFPNGTDSLYAVNASNLFCAAAGLAAIIILMRLLKKISVNDFRLCAATLATQFFVYLFIYPVIFPMRIHCFTISMIFFFWRAYSKNASSCQKISPEMQKYLGNSRIALAIFFFLLIPSGIWFAVKDLKEPFSSAAEIANFIKNNLDNDIPVFSQYDVAESLVLELDGREILFNGGGPLRFSKLNDPILKDLGNSQLTEKGFYLISIAESAGETSILPGTKKIGKNPCFYKTRQAIKRGETFCLSYYMNQKPETEE
ncbi:MAG: hypothetical protein K5838_08115 [Elusimicrobiales bacterium]|nr:hypothetical protein [Elusimicrobiales bacterium]